MADFITHHHKKEVQMVNLSPWTPFFDGSSCKQGGGIGIVIISPRGASFEFAFPIKPVSTNNQVEYEAILKGLQLLSEVKVGAVEIFGDSQLVINQPIGLYECKDDTLKIYFDQCQELIDGFSSISIKHIPRCQNQEANHLAQSASGYWQIYEILNNSIANDADWRKEIIEYLNEPSQKVSRRLRYKATKFVLLDDQLYYRIVDGVLLKCLNQEDAKSVDGRST
jgi:ribonuclease HI